MKRLRDLSELAAARKALARERELAQARAEAEAAARREAERRARGEAELFRAAAGPVAPLAAPPRVPLAPPPAPPVARQRQQDDRRVLREAISDAFDPGTLLETDEGLSWRREGLGADVTTRLRRGHWAIQREIDLHGLRTDEAREALSDFIRRARRDGLRCVRIVHGKGLGSPGKVPVLKGRVHGWLVQRAEVLAFVQARADEGGAGAVVALLAGG